MNLKDLVKKWKYRQAVLNQREQNEISKAKAHTYTVLVQKN